MSTCEHDSGHKEQENIDGRFKCILFSKLVRVCNNACLNSVCVKRESEEV